MIPCQEVEDRVQAAVGAGQWPSDFVCEVDNVEDPAVCIQNTVCIVECPCDVERDKAYSKHNQHYNDEFNGLPPRLALLIGRNLSGATERPCHQAITHHDDNEWDTKEQCHHCCAVVDIIFKIRRLTCVMTQRIIISL